MNVIGRTNRIGWQEEINAILNGDLSISPWVDYLNIPLNNPGVVWEVPLGRPIEFLSLCPVQYNDQGQIVQPVYSGDGETMLNSGGGVAYQNGGFKGPILMRFNGSGAFLPFGYAGWVRVAEQQSDSCPAAIQNVISDFSAQGEGTTLTFGGINSWGIFPDSFDPLSPGLCVCLNAIEMTICKIEVITPAFNTGAGIDYGNLPPMTFLVGRGVNLHRNQGFSGYIDPSQSGGLIASDSQASTSGRNEAPAVSLSGTVF